MTRTSERRGAAFVVALAVLVGACSGGSTHDRAEPTTSQTTASTIRRAAPGAITFPVTLPQRSEPPSALVGDPNGAGVWALASTPSGPAVFHYDATAKQLDTVATGSLGIEVTTSAGLAVDKSGVLWLGGGLHLVRYQQGVGIAESFDLEALLKSVADETPLKPEQRGLRSVNSVAVTPDGSKVVVGFAGSSRLLVYEPPARRWSKLELGDKTALSNVAVSETGTVAAAVDGLGTGHNVLDVWVGSVRKEAPGDMGPVTYRDGRFVRGRQPTVVNATDGSVVLAGIPDTGSAQRVGPFVVGTAGRLIVSTFTGFLVYDSKGVFVGAADIQPDACQTSGPAPAKPTTGATVPCLGRAILDPVVDAAGNVWFDNPRGNQQLVGEFDPDLARK